MKYPCVSITNIVHHTHFAGNLYASRLFIVFNFGLIFTCVNCFTLALCLSFSLPPSFSMLSLASSTRQAYHYSVSKASVIEYTLRTLTKTTVILLHNIFTVHFCYDLISSSHITCVSGLSLFF